MDNVGKAKIIKGKNSLSYDKGKSVININPAWLKDIKLIMMNNNFGLNINNGFSTNNIGYSGGLE